MRIMGLDVSLTSTGVAPVEGAPFCLKTSLKGMERLVWFREQFRNLLSKENPTLVVVEGYAFAARSNSVYQIGELGGLLRMMLHDFFIDFVEVPPTTLKRFATGKGNAGKDEMLAAAIHRLGYEGHSNDEADSLWLREFAMVKYDLSDLKLPVHNLEALKKVEW